MKNLLIVVFALVFALSLAGVPGAQEQNKQEQKNKEGNPPAVQTQAPEGKAPGSTEKTEAKGEVTPKPVVWRMGGIVTAVNSRGKTISIHQETVHHDRVMKFEVDEKAAKELSALKAGDLVNVWVNGETVTAIARVS